MDTIIIMSSFSLACHVQEALSCKIMSFNLTGVWNGSPSVFYVDQRKVVYRRESQLSLVTVSVKGGSDQTTNKDAIEAEDEK